MRINWLYGIYNKDIVPFIIIYKLCPSIFFISVKKNMNICTHLFSSREPVLKHLPAQHCPLFTSRVGFAKWFGKESWNIKTGTKQICKKNHEWQTMEKNHEALWVSSSLLRSFLQSSLHLHTQIHYRILTPSSYLFKVHFFPHILTFLNSRCALTTHMFVVSAVIFFPNTLFRAKPPIPHVLGIGSPPTFPL